MNHLNNVVVAAAQGSNQDLGDLVRDSTVGQIFTLILCAVAIVYIIGRLADLFGPRKSDS